MNDTDFKLAVIDLKREIREQVQESLSKFRERTGMTPSDIRLRMFDATTQEELNVYVLGSVNVEFKL